jgi:hypothetical protein
VAVLLRFRKFYYPLVADVEKAFLQVGLIESERECVRFLWFNSLSEVKTLHFRSFRFTRTPFGVKASPFLLSSVISCQLKSFEGVYPETVAYVRDNIYVDDLITSVPTKEALLRVATEVRAIFYDMKMNLRKWASSDMEVLRLFDSSKDPTLKILGLVWLREQDKLAVVFRAPGKPVRSKRDLAALTCSLFDPLGLVEPFTLRFKILLRKAWDLKIEWDLDRI